MRWLIRLVVGKTPARMLSRRTRTLAAPWAVVALLLVASACSGDDGDTAATDRSTGSSTEPAEETSEETATTEAPATTEATTTTTEAPTTTTTTAPPAPPEPELLQSGVEGARTKALQESLDRLGFDPGEADGQFGTKTTQAVWAFQALNGLAQDGVVSPQLEAQIAAAPPIAMLRPDLGPTHTEVDLDRQVLLVWGDGQLELATHISSGSGVAYSEDGHSGDAITPLGDYVYQRRIEGERHAPLGVLYNPVYFNGGIAVHGAPSVPDHPASHGCVRIPMHISGYFQSLVADGEPIAVFRGGTGPAAPVAPAGGPAAPPPAGAENGG
ncbi:MAG TPA: L,D-transpeptidase family protein [Iamia sp.]|jgi:peptidoglycan hydrolase-like protein with peptidoglycan-binding domain|nr:L,D-transpeptidase family protein [Iamia sp.]